MECGKRWWCAWFVQIAIAVAGCAGAPLPPPRPLLVPPASAAVPVPEPREIHPGLLRGLMIEGELRVPFDGPRPTDVRDELDLIIAIRVCLDRDGNARHEVTIPGKDDAYREAVLATLARWRFRPYTLDGVPLAVCSVARFMPATAKLVDPNQGEALPSARVELPIAVERPVALPRGITGLPATPGVAFARVCRKPGSREAPTFSLLQSSGDVGFDRSLFEERASAPVDEPASSVERCWLRYGIAHDRVEAFDFQNRADGPNVAPSELEVRRISGDRYILPSDRVKYDIAATGQTQVMVPVKVCVATDGRPYQVKVMKSSGHFAYDMDIINGVASWRYRPVSSPTCSAVQFIYRQRRAAPRSRR